MPQQDACTLLDEDHKKVEQLFKEYQSADTARKQQLAQTIAQELSVHMQIEDEIFYPAFLDATGDDDMIEEAEDEHDEARELIARLEGGKADDEVMKDLQKAIEHHVGEERREMFPKARETSGLDLVKLAQELEARKTELMSDHPA
ncbi:hemerythrin domain-containing protein [Ramlibacter montanisoli]|uniref:Hemerythrin domain-containing protein n=1 Tax=Ramlibacter montanisoli TaxID=2732512 RepID=A0A849KR64_9BURK|nr:hemerythrin domain-containing protein [Ramlibacter montanisoli]NNU44309.1 hemerythrin domain-containing protein [Ramlibacter montanisoli]